MTKKEKKQQLPLDVFKNALTKDERTVYDSFQNDLQDPSANQKSIQTLFYAWAAPITERLGKGEPGQVWGAFRQAYAPKKREAAFIPFLELADQLPYPLGFKLRGLLQAGRRIDEGEAEPQYPFELCAVMGVLVRMSSLIMIQAYVASEKNDSKLNHALVSKLRAPSDGGWLDITRQLGKALKGSASPFVKHINTALSTAPKLDKETKELVKGANKTGQALSALVKFRNDLVHGELISDSDLTRARALLEVAVRGFAWLADYELEVNHKGKAWSLNGAMPQPVKGGTDLPEGEPCLVNRDDPSEMLILSPLLRFRAGEGESDLDVDFDELFFLNAGSLERLSYIGYRAANQIDGKTLGSYDAFKAFIAKIPTPPIPQNACIDFSGLAEFHSRLFVGRGSVIKEITTGVKVGESQYMVLKALAGMGKTAIYATLLQAVRNLTSKPADRKSSPADGLVREQDKWVFHFCMPTDGRNSPTVALRSLIAQICDHFKIERKTWLSHDLDQLKDDKFPGLLREVSGKLGDDARLVVVIDALDEGIGADKETVPSCIPAGEYPGVVFLLSYRVDNDCQNSRVEGQLKQVAESRRTILKAANPLAGLTREDVKLYLRKLTDAFGGAEATEQTEQAVWTAATRNVREGKTDGADPFFLRFLADGVQQGAIRLNRAETVPDSLDEAFEEMWMGLPTDQDFLCHRVLLTLGIMREYGDDELFAALFNRERSAEDRLTPNDVAAVRIKAGKLLVYDEDRYGLFHDRFRVFLVGVQKDPIAEALGMT